ncbi:MAG: helix-turn-helix domain-containing protein, partial [Sphingobacterium sp.]
DFRRKLEQLKHSQTIAEALNKSNDVLSKELLTWNTPKDEQLEKQVEEKDKDTKTISLDMFMDGMEIGEIASKRDMVVGTIYGHLINFIGSDLEAADLMEQQELAHIVGLIQKNPELSTSELKQILGPKIDYPQIRIAQKHLELKDSNKVQDGQN